MMPKLTAFSLIETLLRVNLAIPKQLRILYHEMWHAFTYQALEQFPELKAIVRQMMDEATACRSKEDMTETHAYAMSQ